MNGLIEFLRKRNVGEECIQGLVRNKIDNQVLLTMDDDELKTYLPAHGDRIAAFAFCKTLETPANNVSVSPRLLDSVKGKIRRRRHLGNANGPEYINSGRKKLNRRIELGWMAFDEITCCFKQVRAPNGGGTRHLNVPREATKTEVLNVGKQLFFPGGVSKRGPLSDFKFSVRDFKMMEIGEQSVTDLYEKHKVKLLRLYICTEKAVGVECTVDTLATSTSTVQNMLTTCDILPTELCDDEIDIYTDEEVTDEPTGTPTVVFNRGAARRRNLRLSRTQTDVNIAQQLLQHHSEGITEPQNETTETQQLETVHATVKDIATPIEVSFEASAVKEDGMSASLLSGEQGDDELTIFDQSLSDTTENEPLLKKEIEDGFSKLSDLLTDEQELHINRENAANELLALYDEREIICKRVKVVFNGEIGDDLGGLTKDLYTGAWKTIIEEYFTGEDSVVPFLPLHKQRKLSNRYISIGRILTHTAALVQEIPARISRCTLIQLIFGSDGVGEEILLQDFRLFLPPVERHLIGKALSKFSTLSGKESDTLLTVFSVHGLLEIPREAEIKDQVLAMAQNELIHKPSPFLTLMKKGIPESHLDIFWSRLTNDAISYIYKKQIPTPSKLVAAIESEGDLKAEEEASMHYLKQYLYSLDSEELSNFLIFVTGSSSMPDKIRVSFTSLTGLSRRPIAHTCSNFLELPATYSSVQDLKREFKKILSNEYAFQMNMF